MNVDAQFILVMTIVFFIAAVIAQKMKYRSLKHSKHGRDIKCRYVRIRRNRPGLEIAELQIYDLNGVNIAPFGKLSQSSIKNNDELSYGPMIAVNGNISGWAVGELASTREDDDKPWLMIDIGQSMSLSRITLFLRDKSSHPNPNHAWFPASDDGACVEIINQTNDIIWTRPITERKWIHDYSLMM